MDHLPAAVPAGRAGGGVALGGPVPGRGYAPQGPVGHGEVGGQVPGGVQQVAGQLAECGAGTHMHPV